MKTKVLHLLSTSDFSGAENVACQIIDLYKNDANYDMTYCSQIKNNKKILLDRKIPYVELEKFRISCIRKVLQNYQPDIIHAHDIKASIVAALFYKRAKIISHVHANHVNMRKVNLKTFLYNLVSKRFTKIIWVSQSAFDNYVFKNKVIDKSTVLYNVVNEKAIIEGIRNDNKEYINYDLIFLGRLTYQKDPLKLVNIIDKIKKEKKNLKVAIVGTGDMEQEVKNEITHRKIDKNIDFFGFISNPYKILNSSKLLILTSRYEGTPMVALEAISLGVPIISTPTDGMKNIIKNNANGFLALDDDVLAKKVLDILKDDSKLKQMQKLTKDSSIKINDYKKYKKELEQIYQ